MKKIYQEQTQELIAALSNMDDFYDQLEHVVQHLHEAFAKNKTAFVAGNGGSATLAQHFSDEGVGRYKTNRRPLPVVALTADGAVLTCIGNDFGYEEIFARQLEALGQQGDIFIAYSTSGNSKNILRAAEVARERGMTVIAFTGANGKLAAKADYAVISPAASTARIQEIDLHAIHLIFESFEPREESDLNK